MLRFSFFAPFLCTFAALGAFGELSAQSFTLSRSQYDLSVAPGFDHVPLTVPLAINGEGAAAQVQATSDLAWAIPEVDATGNVKVTFATRNLLASATATITIKLGAQTSDVFVSANVKPLSVYRLLDDPYRNVTYGIQFDGANAGAVFTYDPLLATRGACLTVGKRPTDFVISDDGSELLVICSADKVISVVDLYTFSLKETITLPTFDNWGSATDTTANIGLGKGSIIYYTDGSWGPIMRVFNRSTRQVIQSITFEGGTPQNTTGFMDFAITSDRAKMVALPQYGWSAGAHYDMIGHYSIAADGRLTYLGKSTAATGLAREPFEAPALITTNNQTVFLKNLAVSSQNINDIQKSFAGAVWSISPGGEWVATATDIYDYTTGNKLVSIPGANTTLSGYVDTKAQAFTSDYNRFVYFNPTDRSLNSLNLVDLIGPGPDGLSFVPAPGSIVNSPQKLSWASRLGVTQYDLFLGTSADAVNSATTSSPEFMNRIEGTSFNLSPPLTPGTTYYWRLDPLSAVGPQKGPVYSFTVSPISLDRTALKFRGVTGVRSFEAPVQLGATSPGETWSASANQPWISFTSASGQAPATLMVKIDATILPAGVHTGTVTLTTTTGALTIPVEVNLEPINITVIDSDPASSKLYAISENTATAGSKAYLLEIDASTETISRITEVGTSATDLALHRHDQKVYVTNWRSGNLLAVDLATFQVTRTYAFGLPGDYANNDVFRIAAGGPGRLVVEEQDQWIDMRIFNTVTGGVGGIMNAREGGGVFDSTGRYYYHGENNSSGATVDRFDVTGDVFTRIATGNKTTGGGYYYGSRVVVISEDNQRVFWAGAAYTPTLAEEWTMADIVYACSTEGRYGFAENKIYDISRRLHILGMPVTTKVSAYNTATSKLVTQGALGLQFHAFSPQAGLVPPVLTEPTWSGSSLTLKWVDKSLETAFHLQSRVTGTEAWTDVKTDIAQNTVSHSVTGLTETAVYEYRLRGTAPEQSSPWSDVLTVNVANLPPPTPTLTASTTSPYRVNLSWSVTTANSHTVVERGDATGGNWQVIATLSPGVRSYADESLLPSSTYTYRVKMTRNGASSGYSLVKTITTQALTVPSGPTFNSASAVSSYQVNLAWSNSSVATFYRIERKLASASTWEMLAEVPQGTLSFQDTTVSPGTAYSYRLFAINTIGSSVASSVRSATTPALPLPTVPENLAGQAYSSSQIALSWSDSDFETGYLLQRNVAESPWQTVAELPAGTTSHIDAGLANGTYYNYRLIAVNAGGTQAVSGEISVLAALTGPLLKDDFDPSIDLTVWSSLNGGQATSGPQGFYSGNALWFGAAGPRNSATVPADLTNGGTLAFQFRAGNSSADGTTHWENSELNENVIVEFSAAGGPWEVLSILATEYPSHKAWTSYSIVIPQSARSEATRFRWRQLSNSGASQDAWAIDDVEIRGVLPPPPAAPSFIIANANAARAVAVSWAVSAQTTQYRVERRTPTSDWVLAGVTPSFENYFTDTAVIPATAYSYRVIAENTGGLSDPSQYAFVTTWSILQEWRFQNYGTITANGNSANLAENGTGISNLLKFAFNMSKDDRFLVSDPGSNGKGLPFIRLEGEYLQVAFLRRRDPQTSGVRYSVEFASTLGGWAAVGTEVIAEPVSEEFEYVIWRDSVSKASSGSRFARVRVEATN